MKRLSTGRLSAQWWRTHHLITLGVIAAILIFLFLALLLGDGKVPSRGVQPARFANFALLAAMICLEFNLNIASTGKSRPSSAPRPVDPASGTRSNDLLGESISIMYYRHIHRRHLMLGIGLLIAWPLLYVGLAVAGSADPVTLACMSALPPLLYALTSIRRAILRYRVITGLFGTNELEVREFVDFIAKFCGTIDLPGGGATLLPEQRLPRAPANTNGAAEVLQ